MTKILLIEGYRGFEDRRRDHFLTQNPEQCLVSNRCPALGLRDIPKYTNRDLIPKGGPCSNFLRDGVRIRCVRSHF